MTTDLKTTDEIAAQAAELGWRFDTDHYHASAVLEFWDEGGLPVIVRSSGRYPQGAFENPEGETLEDVERIVITLAGSTRHYEEDGEQKSERWWDRASITRADADDELSIGGLGGYGPDEKRHASPYTLLEEVVEALMDDALAASLDDARDALDALIGDMPQTFDSREAYEAFCADRGIETMDHTRYGAKYWSGGKSTSSPDYTAKFFAVRALRRGLKHPDGPPQEQAYEEPQAEQAVGETVRISAPLQRNRVSGAEGDTVTWRGARWRIESKDVFKITADTPSVEGSQYLGHEGESGIKLLLRRLE
jgi:hypothetical protein